jgi:hypothetical protein
MIFGRKKKALFRYQEENNIFGFEWEGKKFIAIPQTVRSERDISAQASTGGAGGSLHIERERGMLDILVIPSGSNQPMPYEKWKELAIEVTTTQSHGAVLPAQIAKVRFAITAGTGLRPPSELIKNRIREAFQLFRRGSSPPDSVEVAFVPSLVNTVKGLNDDELLPYYPFQMETYSLSYSLWQETGRYAS